MPQLSKCPKFMTFRDVFSYARMKEVNISQLSDYDAPFCEQQYTHGSCYISLSKFKSFDQFNTPQAASNFRHSVWHYRHLEWNSPLISLSLHLRGRVVTKGRNIKNFLNSQPLFDVHQQYLQAFLIDLQAEVSRFRC